MGCIELIKGSDVSCLVPQKRYYQNVVLVNKADVDQFNIYLFDEKNRVNFNLKAGKTGYLFASNENKQLINGSFRKVTQRNVNYYNHSLDIPVIGVDENIKTLLRQLDEGEYFGAINFLDGTVEIFGFNYGLKTSPYTFEAQNGLGGIVITLVSDVLEREPPYIYLPKILIPPNDIFKQAVADFDDLFADIDEQYTGDFNNDYNLDFYITN